MPFEVAIATVPENAVLQGPVGVFLVGVPLEFLKPEAPARRADRCIVCPGERDHSANSASRSGVALVEVNRGALELASHHDIGIGRTHKTGGQSLRHSFQSDQDLAVDEGHQHRFEPEQVGANQAARTAAHAAGNSSDRLSAARSR
jgi:hypothetical protein